MRNCRAWSSTTSWSSSRSRATGSKPGRPEDLEHLADARFQIETIVLRSRLLRSAIASADGLPLLRAQRVRPESPACWPHTLVRTPMQDPEDPQRMTEIWATAYAAYHAMLLTGCPNPRRRPVALALHEAAERYRRVGDRMSTRRGSLRGLSSSLPCRHPHRPARADRPVTSARM